MASLIGQLHFPELRQNATEHSAQLLQAPRGWRLKSFIFVINVLQEPSFLRSWGIPSCFLPWCLTFSHLAPKLAVNAPKVSQSSF